MSNNREQIIIETNKPIYYAYGFLWKGAKKQMITKEKAIEILNKSCDKLEFTEKDNEIFIQEFSANDMW